eukprot:CAMPEP_0114050914 /NCGR_PEP_ID=MMETSP1339-20121228/67254_1 /TAXON_ID=94617 /ORGANISM="Fibrocapsa japonica" /LENGTH=44 /assembly_acc=CAM_ASM_000762
MTFPQGLKKSQSRIMNPKGLLPARIFQRCSSIVRNTRALQAGSD